MKMTIPTNLLCHTKRLRTLCTLLLLYLCSHSVYGTGSTKIIEKNAVFKSETKTMQAVRLQAGDNIEITVQDSILFYDDGGAEAKFSPKLKGNISFAPAKEGEVIKLIFRNFIIGSKSNFLIYEGGKIQEEKLKENLVGSSSLNPIDLPLPIFSTSDDGKLCINFLSEASQYQVEAGWEILVVSTQVKALSVEQVMATATNDAVVFGNTDNNLFLRIAFSLEGDTSKCTLNKLTFSAANSTRLATIKKAKLFYSERSDNMDRQLGNVIFENTDSTLQLNFSGSLVFNKPTTYYVWLAYDLGSAIENEKITAKLVSYTIDGKTINPDMSEAVATVKEGMHGKFIVGSSDTANYADLQSAIDALAVGIDGAIILELEAGQYEGPFTLPEIKGSSSANTLSICSQSGHFKEVVIFSNKYIKGNPPTGVFNITGADYVILKNLSFTSSDLTYPQILNIKNASRFLTISNCYFSSPISNGKDYSKTSNLIYTSAENIADKNSDFLVFSNNILEGGYIGLSVGGTGYVVLPKQKGLTVNNNLFSNQGFKSIYVRDHDDVSIFENSIVNNTTDKSGFQAMDLYRVRKQVRVYNNMIQLQTNLAATAIEMRPVTGLAEDRAQVYNNVINFTQTRGISYGINLSDNCAYLDIAHNTILLYDTLSSASPIGIYIKDTVTKLSIFNNIIDNTTGGYVYNFKKAGALKQITFDKNALFTSNPDAFAFAGNALASFELWKEAAQDQSSIAQKAEFYSPTFLALKSAENMNVGKPSDFVKTDILGIERNLLHPTLGAYEFEAPLMEKPILDSAYPQIVKITPNSIELKLKFNQSGLVYAMAKLSTEEMPKIADLRSRTGMEMVKDKEKNILISDLLPNKEYKVYILAVNYIDTLSNIFVGDTFYTQFAVTQISDFENIALGSLVFTDGTASFTNFEIVENTNGIEGSTKAAKMLANSSIRIDNTSEGILLQGFFFQSTDSLIIQGFDAKGTQKTKSIASTENKWNFCNLKDMGLIVRLELLCKGEVLIDNFSGNPLPLASTLKGNFQIMQGENVHVEVSVNGGVAPYSYRWKNVLNKEISSTQSMDSKPMTTNQYSLEVEDAWQNRDTIEFTISVLGDSIFVADFEELVLPLESFWRGNENSNEENSLFYSGSFSFNNSYQAAWHSWTQFAYSNSTKADFSPNESGTHQFRSAAGGGFDKSANFGVVYDMGAWGTPAAIKITNDTNGRILKGMYVSNNAWLYSAATQGDSYSGEAFKNGDYFAIEIYGINAMNDTVKLTHYLADYRNSDSAEHYVSNTWEWVDLSSLGKVKTVFFHTKGSRINDYGELLPAYFCIDNFNVNFQYEILDDIALFVNETKGIDLSTLFTSFNRPQAHLDVDVLSSDTQKIAQIRIVNQQIEIKGLAAGTHQIMLKGSRGGESQFIEFSVNVMDSVVIPPDTTSNETLMTEIPFSIYPIPSSDVLNIKSRIQSYTIEIFNLQGERMLQKQGLSSLSTIDIRTLKAATYILRIYSEKIVHSTRFIKIN